MYEKLVFFWYFAVFAVPLQQNKAQDSMQAIILAAGMGRRLGALTSENTKCMVKSY